MHLGPGHTRQAERFEQADSRLLGWASAGNGNRHALVSEKGERFAHFRVEPQPPPGCAASLALVDHQCILEVLHVAIPKRLVEIDYCALRRRGGDEVLHVCWVGKAALHRQLFTVVYKNRKPHSQFSQFNPTRRACAPPPPFCCWQSSRLACCCCIALNRRRSRRSSRQLHSRPHRRLLWTHLLHLWPHVQPVHSDFPSCYRC